MPRQSPTELVNQLGQEVAVLRSQMVKLQAEVDRADSAELRQRIAVLEDRVNELKRQKDEADKRGWHWVGIALGGVFALFCGALMQLLAYALRK